MIRRSGTRFFENDDIVGSAGPGGRDACIVCSRAPRSSSQVRLRSLHGSSETICDGSGGEGSDDSVTGRGSRSVHGPRASSAAASGNRIAALTAENVKDCLL